jgi:hypothetical protein
MTEEDLIKLAMEESMKEEKEREKKAGLATINLDDELMKTILAMSQNEHMDKSAMSSGIQFALENGFTLE